MWKVLICHWKTGQVTSDVQSRKNHTFDDYYLKRELQMGIFGEGLWRTVFLMTNCEKLQKHIETYKK